MLPRSKMLATIGGQRGELGDRTGAGGGQKPSLGGAVGVTLLTIVLISLGCSAGGGEFTLAGIMPILGAVPLAVSAVLVAPPEVGVRLARYLWPGAAAVCAAINLMPALNLGNSTLGIAATVLLTACVLLISLSPLRGWSWLVAGLGAGADLALAAAKMTWGKAGIDVFWFTQGSTEQLWKGHNPYAAVYPTTTPHLLSAHFPFGPGLLLLAAPFRLIGDVRVANMAAMIVIFLAVAALAMRHGGPAHAGRCLALALALPFVATMISNDWPEVFPVAAVALWLLLRDRHRPWSVLSLGIGLAAVPTVAPLLVLPWLWWRAARTEITAGAVITFLLAVPFALWAGPKQFVADTVGLQLRLAPRPDGLGLNGLLWHLHQGWLPWWLGIGVSATFLIGAAVLAKQTWESALTLGSTLTLIAFVTAKWAFFNYYFIVVVGFVLALAVMRTPSQEPLTRVPQQIGDEMP